MAAGREYIVRNASTDQIYNLWFKNQKFNNKKHPISYPEIKLVMSYKSDCDRLSS